MCFFHIYYIVHISRVIVPRARCLLSLFLVLLYAFRTTRVISYWPRKSQAEFIYCAPTSHPVVT